MKDAASHPSRPVLPAPDESLAYFRQRVPKQPARLPETLTPIEQMFGYFDAD